MPSNPPTTTSPKKRKLRKGATSCWECKRRKTRCVFSAPYGNVCVGCRHRDTLCISQAEKEPILENLGRGSKAASALRLERVEALLEALNKKQRSKEVSKDSDREVEFVGSTPNAAGIPVVEATQKEVSISTTLPGLRVLGTALSETLFNLLPSQEEVESLCATDGFTPCFFQQMLTRNYVALPASNWAPLAGAEVAKTSVRNAHPVLIARKLLMFACLTYHPHSNPEMTQWQARAEQMASAAIDLVTTRDSLVCNAEGLECLMMEATYHVNNEDIRRAFGAVRRAMATAHLLGIHRPLHRHYQRIDDTASEFDPGYMWYRIVYADQIFCLILGLPQGSTDISFAEPLAMNGFSAEEVLDRTHCAIASRILARNDREPDSMALTRSIDEFIQATTSTLPSGWWSIPTFSKIAAQRDIFIATTQLVSQVLHFNLINQTHLPYLLKSDHSSPHAAAYEYSKTACATASREILDRYLVIQESNFVAHACHFVDFFALIAAITLLILHLERHWQTEAQQPNILSHMRQCDRARVMQAMSFLKKAPVCKGPKILEQLLAIEDEAFVSRSVGAGKILRDDPDRRPYFELRIPFYGNLKVSSVKICLERAHEIEELSSSIRTLPVPECQGGEGEGEGDGPPFQDWSLNDFGAGIGDDAFGGVENAFFDSFHDFLEV